MPSLIENFNNLTEEDFNSYPVEDAEPNGYELTGGTLHIFGNTWKIQYLNTPMALNSESVWSIRAMVNNNTDTNETSEIQGFGLAVVNPDGSIGDRIKYAFGGAQQVDSDDLLSSNNPIINDAAPTIAPVGVESKYTLLFIHSFQ